MTADEAADVEADNQAVAEGRMHEVEAQVAEETSKCATSSELYWQETDKETTKWVPIHSDYLLDRFMHDFQYERSNTTKFGIAVAGEGPNYSGGLSYSRSNGSGFGYGGTKGGANGNVNHMWKARWFYAKQIQKCFNGGYPFKTGRTRWIADRRQGGFDAFQPDGLSRFVCETGTGNKARVGVNYWVSRETSRTWNGWFSIANVKLPASARFDLSNTDTTKIRATYVLRNSESHGYLCGKGTDITRASFVEEVS